MSLPDFTLDEQLLVNSLKVCNGSGTPGLWGFVAASAILTGCGAYYQNIPLLVITVILLFGFRINEERQQSKWAPIYRTIIEKYELALQNDDEPQDVDS